MPSTSASTRKRKHNNAAAAALSSTDPKRAPAGPLPSKPTTRLERLLFLLLLSTLTLLLLHAYRLYARPYVVALTDSHTYTSPFASTLDNVKGVFKLGAKVVTRSDPEPGASENEGAGIKDFLMDMVTEDNTIEDQGLEEEGYTYGSLNDMLDAVYGKDRVEGEYAFKKGDRFHLGKQPSDGEDVKESAQKMAAQGSRDERKSRFRKLAAALKGFSNNAQDEGTIADDVNQAADL
ncbi:hypothetical protein OC861_002165 [Tilletia horrida]|nr:hypothetical protein OC845_001890 [Tilletia horrida]KAK0568222.1 hypothetical protein OC861_002165 [Tilletia horrida]